MFDSVEKFSRKLDCVSLATKMSDGVLRGQTVPNRLPNYKNLAEHTCKVPWGREFLPFPFQGPCVFVHHAAFLDFVRVRLRSGRC